MNFTVFQIFLGRIQGQHCVRTGCFSLLAVGRGGESRWQRCLGMAFRRYESRRQYDDSSDCDTEYSEPEERKGCIKKRWVLSSY